MERKVNISEANSFDNIALIVYYEYKKVFGPHFYKTTEKKNT